MTGKKKNVQISEKNGIVPKLYLCFEEFLQKLTKNLYV